MYGPQCEEMHIFGYLGRGGGLGGPYIIRLGPSCFQLSSHVCQSTYKIWKQSDKDFVSYCENDEMSADGVTTTKPKYIRTGMQ